VNATLALTNSAPPPRPLTSEQSGGKTCTHSPPSLPTRTLTLPTPSTRLTPPKPLGLLSPSLSALPAWKSWATSATCSTLPHPPPILSMSSTCVTRLGTRNKTRKTNGKEQDYQRLPRHLPSSSLASLSLPPPPPSSPCLPSFRPSFSPASVSSRPPSVSSTPSVRAHPVSANHRCLRRLLDPSCLGVISSLLCVLSVPDSLVPSSPPARVPLCVCCPLLLSSASLLSLPSPSVVLRARLGPSSSRLDVTPSSSGPFSSFSFPASSSSSGRPPSSSPLSSSLAFSPLSLPSDLDHLFSSPP
jgi:hypothetical protein